MRTPLSHTRSADQSNFHTECRDAQWTEAVTKALCLGEVLESKWTNLPNCQCFSFFAKCCWFVGRFSFLASSLKAAHHPNFSKKAKFVYRDRLPKTHLLQNLTSVPLLSSLYVPKATWHGVWAAFERSFELWRAEPHRACAWWVPAFIRRSSFCQSSGLYKNVMLQLFALSMDHLIIYLIIWSSDFHQ